MMSDIDKLKAALSLIEEIFNKSNYDDKDYSALVSSVALLEKVIKYRSVS